MLIPNSKNQKLNCTKTAFSLGDRMPNYRKLRPINLIAGVSLILLSIGLITPIAPLFSLTFDNSGIPLGLQILFLLVFIFIGGYEIGKYEAIRATNNRRISLAKTKQTKIIEKTNRLGPCRTLNVSIPDFKKEGFLFPDNQLYMGT